MLGCYNQMSNNYVTIPMDVNVQVDAIYSVWSIYYTENNIKPITYIICPQTGCLQLLYSFSQELNRIIRFMSVNTSWL